MSAPLDSNQEPQRYKLCALTIELGAGIVNTTTNEVLCDAAGSGRNDVNTLLFLLLWRDAVGNENLLKFSALDGLFLDKLFCDCIERAAMFTDDFFCTYLRLGDDAGNLGINLCRDFF